MKKFRNTLIIIVCLVAPTIWMTMNVLNEANVNCKVCMSFRGQQNCGKAVGKDKESCVGTAKDNACALIASGMDASIQCSQKQPDSVDVQ